MLSTIMFYMLCGLGIWTGPYVFYKGQTGDFTYDADKVFTTIGGFILTVVGWSIVYFATGNMGL